LGATGLPIGLWFQVERILNYLFDTAIYERANTVMSLGVHRLLRNIVLSSVAGRVLDVGCGDGVYIPQLVRTAEEVVCIDPIATKNTHNYANFHRVVATAERIPFRAKSFDFAIAMFSFRDFMDKALGIFNMRKASRKGVFILDLFAVSRFLLPAVVLYFGYIAPILGFIVSGGHRGRWELLIPTLQLMPRADFFTKLGGKALIKKGLGLVAVIYIPSEAS